ncbi:hypothetical protein C1H46_029978 [Malus baccata]|uniref:Uncharacterized protein n=1 Tax=Malus baccata TaxID=106549 RepID=A0A540LD89_MALBA|nr:hypothetical protein C1H46_029978 [Malus baccata]
MAASLPLRMPKAREGGRMAHLERVAAESMGVEGMWAERIIQSLPTTDDRVAPVGVTEADTYLHAEAPDVLETPLATEARKVDFRFRGVENVRVDELGLENLLQGFEQGFKIDTGAEMYVHNQPKELYKDNHIKNVNYRNYFLKMAGVSVVTAVSMVGRRNRVVIGWAFGGRRRRMTPLEVFFLSLNA